MTKAFVYHCYAQAGGLVRSASRQGVLVYITSEMAWARVALNAQTPYGATTNAPRFVVHPSGRPAAGAKTLAPAILAGL